MNDHDDIAPYQFLVDRFKQLSAQVSGLTKQMGELDRKVDGLMFQQAEERGASKLRARALTMIGGMVGVGVLALQIYTTVRGR